MRFLVHVSVLPAGLLAVLATIPCLALGQESRWPYNLPSHMKYYPEDERLVRREEVIQEVLQRYSPVGVKKMSHDEGEKFFLDYWSFASTGSDVSILEEDWRLHQHGHNQSLALANGTVLQRSTPPLLRHSTLQSRIAGHSLPRRLRSAFAPRLALEERDFRCPTGTSSCASIGRPDNCCNEDQTCQLVDMTGLGDVGCCAAGEICASGQSNCAPGYTSCPNFDAGGCCVPGYACVSGGCLLGSTATVLVSPSPPSTSSTPLTSTSIVVSTSTASVSVSSVSTASASISSITTAIRAPSTSDEPTATATTTNTLACSSGFRSCPASLGGGCCPTDRACGSDVCPEVSSTATIGAPVRPTSDGPQITSQTSGTACPTGFYACSAFYQGGCCRYGRDCAPTSCPSNDKTSLIDDQGITVVATATSGLSANTLLTGDCATGWSSCAAGDGGGCCPSGFECGNSCTATATDLGVEGTEVAKIAPNRAEGGNDIGKGLVGVGMFIVALLFITV